MRQQGVSSHLHHPPHLQKAPDTPGINSKLKRILPVSPRSLIHLPVCHSYFYGGTLLIGLLPPHDNSRPSESLTKGARPDIKRHWTVPQISLSWEGNLAIMQHNRTNLSFTTCSVCGHAGKMSWKPKVAAEERKKKLRWLAGSALGVVVCLRK